MHGTLVNRPCRSKRSQMKRIECRINVRWHRLRDDLNATASVVRQMLWNKRRAKRLNSRFLDQATAWVGCPLDGRSPLAFCVYPYQMSRFLKFCEIYIVTPQAVQNPSDRIFWRCPPVAQNRRPVGGPSSIGSRLATIATPRAEIFRRSGRATAARSRRRSQSALGRSARGCHCLSWRLPQTPTIDARSRVAKLCACAWVDLDQGKPK